MLISKPNQSKGWRVFLIDKNESFNRVMINQPIHVFWDLPSFSNEICFIKKGYITPYIIEEWLNFSKTG
ncbi:hypothetical protein Xekj_00614 [Xenorhabdus sp. KJ12.1]|nr:hypothetical protein Xekj_00614 [Xenorhabdus sp. KJ12.1]